MPTTYAHDLFGRMVYQKLDIKTQEMILRYQSLFQIGLHGPDILFYYEPFHKNEVSSHGSRMHLDIAADFFKEGKKLYLEKKDDRVLVYILGFICHYMLDSSCHPYIYEYIKRTGAGHDEIETDFDRYLMEITDKNPKRYKPACVIRATTGNAYVVAQVLKAIPEYKIRKALKGMRFYTGIVVGDDLWRNALLTGARVLHCYDLAQGRIMRRNHLASCSESTEELTRIMKLAIPETVTVIDEFLRELQDVEHINARFYRNYE